MDTTNTNTALCSALCEELARSGMRRAVVCPGSRSTPLALALERNPAIETTVVLDERSAGFVALGAALSSNLPVAVLTTSGSAAANLHPAVVEANEASVPLICITADRPPELRGIGAGQTIDQIKLFGDSVRWFSEVGTHEADDTGLLHMRSIGCRAFAVATGDPRPGPVHLNIALREPLAPTPDPSAVTASSELALQGRGAGPLNRVVRGPRELEPEAVEDLASELAAARRPLLISGLNRNGERLAHSIARLAEEAGAPILAEPTSQLRWGGHDLSRVITTYDPIARSAREEMAPDLVVRVGEMPTSKALRQWLAAVPELRQIVIAPDSDWKEPTRTAGITVRANPEKLLEELAERLSVLPERNEWLESWKQADTEIAASMRSAIDREAGLSEPGVWPALAQVLADGDRVYCASSMPIRDLEVFMPTGDKEVRFFSNRGANGIDGQISTAIGVSGDGLGITYAVLGDLAFAHDQGALGNLDRARGLKLIVIDNGGGGIFSFLPVSEAITGPEMERLFTTPSGLDAAGLAEAHGLRASRPVSPGELEAALAGDSQVIVVQTDREKNVELHRRINQMAENALLG